MFFLCSGIDVVRNKIKMFAQQKVTLPPGRHKIVILDEADSMTDAAQQALRRLMELYSSTTRFAFACNISTKIIEPIQSRCAILRFTRLNNAQIVKRLKEVAAVENVCTIYICMCLCVWKRTNLLLFQVTVLESGYEALVFAADGDMRQALNSLQATYFGFQTVSGDNVWKVCDMPHPSSVKAVLQRCLTGQFDEANSLLTRELWKKGYSALDIIGALFRVVKTLEMDEYLKLEFIKEISFYHLRIINGVASLLQLTGLLAKLCSIAKGVKK